MTRARLRDRVRPQLRHHLGELLRSAGDAIKALADDLFGFGRHPVEELLQDQLSRMAARLDRIEHTSEWVPDGSCWERDNPDSTTPCTWCADHSAPCPCPRCRVRVAVRPGAAPKPCTSCQRRGCLAPEPEDA